MPLNYVTLTLDLYDGQGNYPFSGSASFVPSAVLTDAGVEIVGQQPITAVFRAGSVPSVKLLATDNSGPVPAGWTWQVSFSGITGAPSPFSFFLPFTGGSSQLLSSLVPVASGTAFGAIVPAVVTLTDAATIAVDASLGNLFRVTLGGDRTLGNPVNGVDGQLIRVEVTQDGTGSRHLSYGTAYDFGSSGAPTLSTAAGKRDELLFGYDAAASKWDCLAFAGGY